MTNIIEDNNGMSLEDWVNSLFSQPSKPVEPSSCRQVHPIIAAWLSDWLSRTPPQARPSIQQAIACLSAEVLVVTPPGLRKLFLEQCDADEVSEWIQDLLVIGQAFQRALDRGQFDDL